MTVNESRLSNWQRLFAGTYVSQFVRSTGSCLLIGLSSTRPTHPRSRGDEWPEFGFLVENAHWKVSLRKSGDWEVVTSEDLPEDIDKVLPNLFSKRVLRARFLPTYVGLLLEDGTSIVFCANSDVKGDEAGKNYVFYEFENWKLSLDADGQIAFAPGFET